MIQIGLLLRVDGLALLFVVPCVGWQLLLLYEMLERRSRGMLQLVEAGEDEFSLGERLDAQLVYKTIRWSGAGQTTQAYTRETNHRQFHVKLAECDSEWKHSAKLA